MSRAQRREGRVYELGQRAGIRRVDALSFRWSRWMRDLLNKALPVDGPLRTLIRHRVRLDGQAELAIFRTRSTQQAAEERLWQWQRL